MLTRTPACRAVTREHHLHVLFRRRRTLADIGEGRGGIDGATDACICHRAGDEEHRPVSGRGKRQATRDRNLAWLGPEEVEENLGAIEKRLSSSDFEELAASRAVMPPWLAEPVSALMSDA